MLIPKVSSGLGPHHGYVTTLPLYSRWTNESLFPGRTIHDQLAALGGLEKIDALLPDWPISDDTVMHIALAEGKIQNIETTTRLY